MNRSYVVRNVKRGVLLQVRIKRGENVVRQESLVKGAFVRGSVPANASLQIREFDITSGGATRWETIMRPATAPKKKPKKKPAKKKAKKSTPNKKGKKKAPKKAKKKAPKKAKKKKPKKKGKKKKNPCPPKRKA